MVAPGNKDLHRRSMSGIRVKEQSSWGADKARERYGAIRSPDIKPKDQSKPQRLGDPSNLRQEPYDPNHAKDWVRGFGKNGQESAEGYKYFDKSGRR